MTYINTIITKVLDKDIFKKELSNIISILNNGSIQTADILFGVAWGNVYGNWAPFRVDINEIENEINKAEQLKVGRFGDDDFYIILKEIEILFCHEKDIHLSFNKHNPIVSDIIKLWSEKNIIQIQKEGNGS